MISYIYGWIHFRDFSGRTTRSEYWSAFLFGGFIGFIMMIVLSVLLLICFDFDAERAYSVSEVICSFLSLIMSVPYVSMTVRRLNDAGYSYKSFLWLLVPVIGSIALFARLNGRSTALDESYNHVK